MCPTRRCILALLAAGLGLLAGCDGGDDGGGNGEPRSFDGTWVMCRTDDGPDYREILSIAGTSVAVSIVSYGTDDLTCDGDGTLAGSDTFTATFGATVPADGVDATQVDFDLGGEVFYTLVYRDESTNPDALHLGLDDAVHDGSTPALRPIHLQEQPRALQTTPVPADTIRTSGNRAAGCSRSITRAIRILQTPARRQRRSSRGCATHDNDWPPGSVRCNGAGCPPVRLRRRRCLRGPRHRARDRARH